MNRRSFFKFMPIAPAALMVEGAQAAAVCDRPRDGECHITLQGSKEEKRHPTSLGFALPTPDPHKQVSMAVGQDGNLWLKTKNGQWKRVVTE